MVIRKLLSKTGSLARGVAHMGRLGKLAGQRSFLTRERKKFLLKLGERTLELLKEDKIQSQELARLAAQVEKINALLKQFDYGGTGGNSFKKSPRKPKSTTHRKSKSN